MPYPFTAADVIVPLEDTLNDVVEAANAGTQTGLGGITPSIVGTPRLLTFSFPVAYASAPSAVIAVPRTGTPHLKFASCSAWTATTYTIAVTNTNDLGDVNFTWVAYA